MPKRISLPSMLPPDCDAPTPVGRRPSPSYAGMPACSRQIANNAKRHEDHEHRRQHRPALPRVADHLAERVAQGGGDHEDRQHFQEVRERRRVLERMGRVDVEEPAAVGPELLDRDLRRRRAHRAASAS